MAGKKKNPNNRRKDVKHASIEKRYNSRIRQEYIDMDYLDQLDDTIKNCTMPDGTPCTELEYISSFMREWNNAGIVNGSVKDKTNTKAKKNKFHRTSTEAKACTDRNNHRNRDMYGIAKAQNMVHRQDYETLQDWLEEKQEISHNYTEDALIDILDETYKFGNPTKDTDDDT